MLLLFALIVGMSSAWADDYSLTPNQSSTGSNATTYITTLTEFTHNNVSWKMNQWNPKNLQVKTNQSNAADEFRFYNTSAFPGRITKVVITFSALTVSDASKLMFLGGTSQVTATTGGTAGTWDSSKKTLTWTPGDSDNYTYFAFYQNGKAASGTNYLASSDAIVVTYETDVCAKPTFSVNTGTYDNDQSVTISCSTSGATIHYTTDGSAPTSNSTQYSGAITVNSTQTIKAIAVKSGKTDSEVASATYTMVAANPTFSVAAGTYNNNQSVTLETNTTGATIRYTTDGTTPTENSTAYSEAITVASSQTIKAKAFKTGYTASDEASAAYVLTVATPTISVAAGTYNEAKSVELNCTTTDAVIRYTTDGSTPTSSSTEYSGAISVDVSKTIKAKAFKTGYNESGEVSATYTLKCATPTITKADGDFVTTKEITMATTTNGASIYYTTDESTPTTSSTLYDPENKPVISATTTFKAIAVKDGWTNSEVKEQTYTKQEVLEGLSALVTVTNTSNVTKYVNLTDAQVTWVNNSNGFMEDANTGIYLFGASPTLNKVYNGIFKVTYQRYNNMPEIKAITNVEGEITDGSAKSPTVMTPSELDAAFTANLGRQIQINSFTVPTNSKKLTDNIDLYGTSPFVAVDYGKTYKLVGYPFVTTNTKTFRVTAAYEKPAAPTFTPAACDFYEDFELTMSCTMEGAAIYYTTDGTEPTTSSTLYNAEAKPTISATTTVKAIAEKAGMVSDVATATYTFYSVKQPTFGTASGTSVYYNDKVTVTCETSGSSLYYTMTTDGSDPAVPTSASTAYPEGGITIAANTVKIKVIAKNGENYSPVAEATYTLKNPDAPTADPGAGAVERGTTIALSSRAGTTIYYTTDGTAPTSSSTAYTTAITIDDAKTIKAVAIDGAGNSSSVLTAAYTIVKVATPAFSVAAGNVAQNTIVSLTCATEGASIYYTTDESTPTASSTEYTGAIIISANMTIKAIAVKANCDDSDVASATYTTFVPVSGYNIDFEASDLAQYVNWTFNNIALRTSKKITPHNNSNNYGINGSSSTATQGTSTAFIVTKAKVAHPGSLKFYISKESDNTSVCYWYVEVSENGSSWTQVGDAQSASSMSKGNWVEVSRDLSTYSNVYVRIRYGSNTAIRAIDDISLTETKVDVKIPESGYLTYCSPYALDFSETVVEAYTAAYDNDKGKVVLTEVEDGIVPANVGVVVHSSSAAGNYPVPVTTTEKTTLSGNEMVGVTVQTPVAWTSDGKYNYILQQGKFRKATGASLTANRAYLHTSFDVTQTGGAPELDLAFGDETTTIQNIERTINDNKYYTLDGRCVETPSKGIYIVNGKKVVVK